MTCFRHYGMRVYAGALLVAIAFSGPTAGRAADRGYLRPTWLPDQVRSLAVALGERVRKPGKERVVAQGILTGQGMDASVRIVWELPGRVRLDAAAPHVRSILFDGQQSRSAGASLSEIDLDTLESLAADTAEGFLWSVKRGSAVRLLGRRYRIEDESRLDHPGQLFDIYELLTPVKERGEIFATHKMYYFDSVTHLLHSVHYMRERQGVAVRTETVFAEWNRVNEQMVPGRIVRSGNGQVIFEFHATSVAFGPHADDGFFGLP